MNNQSWLIMLTAALTTAMMALALPAVAAENLNLASEPLFSGTSAKPNVLVAVDDSGSMDQEVLFPTDEGVLYWRLSTDSAADSNGRFYNSGNNLYTYVFPFDHIQNNPTIPPSPTVAYARDPDYNKAYFNPTPNPDGGRIYPPWLKGDGSRQPRPDEPETDARYDPQDNAGTIDLTREQTGTFYYESGMVILGTNDPGKTVYYCVLGTYPFYEASQAEIDKGECRYRFLDLVAVNVDGDGSTPDETVTSGGNRNVSYFPATFYLKAPADRKDGDATLPANYGYKPDKTIEGKGPAGNTLVGYEIKRDNFDTEDQYKAAIRDFANWFTYYRKRNLATRGGIVAAFDRISDIRVGSCTINGREPLDMKDLDEETQRTEFYSDIFNIDYSKNQGTPNRKALDHLGKQLEGKSRGNRDSIITAPCQRNFAILFTDGYSEGRGGPSVGKVDDDYGEPFADGLPNTIADIAMKYYKHLDTNVQGILKAPEGCDDPNPPKRLDCETDLHMTTFGVTLNQTGTIFNQFDTEDHKKQNSDPYKNWPDWPNVNTGGKSAKQIDDLWHATINTRGELLNAETPAEVADKFTTALERILGTKGAATSIATSSASLATDSVAYQATFTAGAWTGQLLALPQNKPFITLGDPIWNAAERLTNHTNPEDRVILTRTRSNCGNGNTNRTTIPLLFDSLKRGCPELTQTQVDYIRGERDQERANTGTLRNRNNNILGDIVHSSPLYVGKPNRPLYPADWNDLLQDGNENTSEDKAGAFSSFAQTERDPMVYVGANDGMLHGFDAATGDEKIAYVPGAVLGRLGALANANYTHQYYVDGSPASGDVVINNRWQTVLVGGLGAGGRSIYALNITNPDNFSDTPSDLADRNPDRPVLWEYENTDLGYTFGKPSIVRLHDGRWAAVFGNGYNSKSGHAELFIVDIATGRLIKKIDTGAGPAETEEPDPDYGCRRDEDDDDCDDDDDDDDDEDGNGALIKICLGGVTFEIPSFLLELKQNEGATLGACSTGDETVKNGLSEVFPVDLDGDFITDYIYAGDLQGNMWKFDLTDKSSNKWKVGMGGKPLFTAEGPDGTPQPITTQPQVAKHTYGDNYGVMVYFGTGKYFEKSDRYAKTKTINSFYGIQDIDVFTFNKNNNGEGTYETSLKSDIPRSRLEEQQITETIDKNGDTYRLVSDKDVAYQTEDDEDDKKDDKGKRGWFLDLPEGEGEMVITNSQIVRDAIAFSTAIPNTKTCGASGSGFVMLLDRETGGRLQQPAFDLNGDKQINSSDTLTRKDKDGNDTQVSVAGRKTAGGIPGPLVVQTAGNGQDFVIFQDTSGEQGVAQPPIAPDQRWSWREIRR